jgi:hypothetical protein
MRLVEDERDRAGGGGSSARDERWVGVGVVGVELDHGCGGAPARPLRRRLGRRRCRGCRPSAAPSTIKLQTQMEGFRGEAGGAQLLRFSEKPEERSIPPLKNYQKLLCCSSALLHPARVEPEELEKRRLPRPSKPGCSSVASLCSSDRTPFQRSRRSAGFSETRGARSMKLSVLHRSSRLLRALTATPGGAGEAQGPPTSIILPDSQRSSRFQRSRRIAGSPGLRPRTGRLQMGEAQH